MYTAADYLRELSLAMNRGCRDDCVTHACRIAELLLEQRQAPWIARIRDVSQVGELVMYGPLIPKRFAGEAIVWTTHYVACAEETAYDPIVGAPIAIDEYALVMFGRRLPMATHLDTAETGRLLHNGEILRRFRPAGRSIAGV